MIRFTWTPKVGKRMAFMDIIMGVGLLAYMLLGLKSSSIEFRVSGLGFRVFGFGGGYDLGFGFYLGFKTRAFRILV